MRKASHTGKIILTIALIFVVALAAAGYYGFGHTNPEPNVPAPTANNDKPEAKADDKPVDPTPQQLAQIMAPLPEDVIYGSDKAPVTIVEYASLSCPHCAHFYEKELPEVKKQLIDTGKAKIVFRHFPHNEPGLRAAQLVNCADPKQRPGFIKALFDAQDNWAFNSSFLADLKSLTSTSGMDSAAVDSCLADKSGETRILESRKQAVDLAQVNSVPSFIINGVVFKESPTAEHIKAAVDAGGKAPEAPAATPAPAATTPTAVATPPKKSE